MKSKKIFFYIVLISISINVFSQDKKIVRLFNKSEYCDCIKRCDKLFEKKRKSVFLYYKAASLYQIHKNPNLNCNIQDPLKESIKILIKLKNKRLPKEINIKEFDSEFIKTYTNVYNAEIQNKNWEKADSYINYLINYNYDNKYYLDKAYCEYFMQKDSAVLTIIKALTNMNGDSVYFFDKSYNILLDLSKNKMVNEYDGLIYILSDLFPKNETLLADLRGFSLSKWDVFMNRRNTSKLIEVAKVFEKYFKDDIEIKKKVNTDLIKIADSLTNLFVSNTTNVNAITSCASFLINTREVLGSYVSDIKKAKFYSLKINKQSAVKLKSINNDSIYFYFEDNPLKIYGFNVENMSIVPPIELNKVKDYIWQNAPKNKQAKKPDDLINKETLNYYLLDSLTHVYLNKFRKENNLPPLLWSKELYRASKHHSKVMACKGAIWHGEILDSNYANIDSIKMYLKLFAGENCQASSFKQPIKYNDYASKIIEIWKSSPGHRQNMLNNYTKSSENTTITEKHIFYAIIINDKLLTDFMPEYKKIFEIYPGIKQDIAKTISRDGYKTTYSSQNFPKLGL